MSQAGQINVLAAIPQIPTTFKTDSDPAIPIANELELLTSVVSARDVPFLSDGAANVVTHSIQYASAVAASDAAKVGLSAFDSAFFSVNSVGFVSYIGAAGQVDSVSGTADRITISGTAADPIVDIASTYVGQTSLTTVGTISTGTWNADVISEAYGGTNQSTYATGDILYASASNTLSKLTAGADGEVLKLASGVPTWATDAGGQVDSVSGTTNRIDVTGTAADPIVDISSSYVGQASITTLGTVTTGTWNADTLGVDYGGSGRTSATAYAVLCGGTTSTGAHQSIAGLGTSGQVLTSNGAGTLPTFQDAAASGILTITGDDSATISPDGAGDMSFTGTAVAAGVNFQALYVDGSVSGNQMKFEIQVSEAVNGAPNNKNDAGVCSFDDTSFAVDSDGYVTYVGPTGDVTGPVSSTDNALARWDGTGGDTLQNSTVIVTDNGEMTNASQPLFSARVSSAINNVTGDGTVYNPVVYDSEISDVGSVYNASTGVFTAPVSGKYLICFADYYIGLTASHTKIFETIITSNRNYFAQRGNIGVIRSGDNDWMSWTSVIADMDASDTASIYISINGGTKVVDINTDSLFQAYLIA